MAVQVVRNILHEHKNVVFFNVRRLNDIFAGVNIVI